MKVKSTPSQIGKEYLLPMLIEYALLALFIFLFALVIDKGPMIDEARLLGDEMTSPTLGRAAYGIFAVIMFMVLALVASKEAKKGRDIPAFFIGFASGILLWQAWGEISWHYSVAGENFLRLENVSAFPFAVVFVLLLIYGIRTQCFDWGIWCVILSFACNWLGHFVMLGTYPFVSGLMESRTWNIASAIVCGCGFFIYSIIYLLLKADTTKKRLLASMMTYISIGVIAFGFIDG